MKKLIMSILVLVLVAFSLTACGKKECGYCDGTGTTECTAKIYTEKLSGIPQYGHDCGLCEYGTTACTFCDGTGVEK